MKDSDRTIKIVEWSETDQCYVGSAPGLFLGGCHGENEQAVFNTLCELIEETVKTLNAEGEPLPPPTAGLNLADCLRTVA